MDERLGSDYDLALLKTTTTITTTATPSSVNTPETEEKVVSYINVGIDAQFAGNEARFINDYRGTGVSRPNAVFKDSRGDPDGKGELTIGVWTAKDGIDKGDEILVSYGRGWWQARREAEGADETTVG